MGRRTRRTRRLISFRLSSKRSENLDGLRGYVPFRALEENVSGLQGSSLLKSGRPTLRHAITARTASSGCDNRLASCSRRKSLGFFFWFPPPPFFLPPFSFWCTETWAQDRTKRVASQCLHRGLYTAVAVASRW